MFKRLSSDDKDESKLDHELQVKQHELEVIKHDLEVAKHALAVREFEHKAALEAAEFNHKKLMEETESAISVEEFRLSLSEASRAHRHHLFEMAIYSTFAAGGFARMPHDTYLQNTRATLDALAAYYLMTQDPEPAPSKDVTP